jgi:poly(A) polymerase
MNPAQLINQWLSSPKPSVHFTAAENEQFILDVLPEVWRMKEFVKSRDELINTFIHTMKVVDNIASFSDSLPVRWAALLHDTGKPVTLAYNEKSEPTYYSHHLASESIADEILHRLQALTEAEIAHVKKLVRHHMFLISTSSYTVTDKALRRLIREFNDNVQELTLLWEADVTTTDSIRKEKVLGSIGRLRTRLLDLQAEVKKDTCILPVNGKNICDILKIPPSPQVGEIIAHLKNEINEGRLQNDRNVVIDYVQSNYYKI